MAAHQRRPDANGGMVVPGLQSYVQLLGKVAAMALAHCVGLGLSEAPAPAAHSDCGAHALRAAGHKRH